MWGIVIGAVVFVTRLPFLGYGEDPDGWRVIIAAQHLIDTGEYVPSRAPGYPLPEYFDALMLWLGAPVLICVATALLSGIAAALIYALFEPLGQVRAAAGALAFAFTPTVFVVSTGAMDFMWGAALFVAATLSATRNKVWWAGVLFGLAVATRPTYLLAAIPLLAVGPWRRLAGPLAVGAGIGALFYIPAVISLGGQIVGIASDSSDRMLRVAFLSTVGLFGAIGVLVVLAACVSALIRREGRDGTLNQWAGISIAAWGALFLLLPHDPAYLIPALPGLYWLICRYAHTAAVAVMAGGLVVSCFLLDVDASERRVSIPGPVLANTHTQAVGECIAHTVRPHLDDSYIVAGVWKPQLTVQLDSNRILYTIRDGADTEHTPIPAGAHIVILDRAVEQQQKVEAINLPVLPTNC